MVAERRDLVADALQRVAEPATINNKATSNGIASGFVADKFDVHINRVGVNLEDKLNNNSYLALARTIITASPTLLSGKGLFNNAIIILGKRQCWARAEVVYVVF